MWSGSSAATVKVVVSLGALSGCSHLSAGLGGPIRIGASLSTAPKALGCFSILGAGTLSTMDIGGRFGGGDVGGYDVGGAVRGGPSGMSF